MRKLRLSFFALKNNNSLKERSEKKNMFSGGKRVAYTLEKAKSLDQIYEEVEGYDIVFTNDAPLRDAINGRRNGAILGYFAVTPKQYAKQNGIDAFGTKPLSKPKLCLKASETFDLELKEAHLLISRALDCWEKTGSVEEIKKYDLPTKIPERELVNFLREEPSINLARELLSPPDGSVAVVGLDLFTELDKQILPESYEVINIFGEEDFELPKFYGFTSRKGIVEEVSEQITKDNCQDIAVVGESESYYTETLKAHLEAEGIPYKTRRDIVENPEIRKTLKLLEISLRASEIRVRNVRNLLSSLGIEVPHRYNNYYLDRYVERPEGKNLRETYQKIRNLEGKKIKESLKILVDLPLNLDIEKMLQIVKDIGIGGKPVNTENLQALEFALKNFDYQGDTEKRGVLFANPKSTSYIDRPVVFFMGMEEDWDSQIPDRDWIEREEEEEKNLKQFKTIIQNGSRQYYLVLNPEDGRGSVTPSLYFNSLFEDFDSFQDFNFSRINKKPSSIRRKISESPEFKEKEKIYEPVSKGTLNSLYNCPKNYFFQRLIDGEKASYFTVGNVIHEFAEFYFEHKKIFDKVGKQKFIDLMINDLKPLITEGEEGFYRTELSIGISNIISFLENENIEESPLIESYVEGVRNKNRFADKFDVSIENKHTERRFKNPEIFLKGRVDLVNSSNKITDYKTGREKSIYEIVRKCNPNLMEDEAEFEPAIYLLDLRSKNPGERLEFSYYYPTKNIEDEIKGEGDWEENETKLIYHPEYFDDFITKEEAYEYLYSSNQRKKVLDRFGSFEDYSELMGEKTIPEPFDKEKLLESQLHDELLSEFLEKIGDYKYVRKGVASILKKLVELRKTRLFKEDLDKLEDLLKEKIPLLNFYEKYGFPVYVNESSYENCNYKDLVWKYE